MIDSEKKPREETYTISNCSRCQQEHVVTFKEFKTPIVTTEFTFEMWGMCPVVNEPIVMAITTKAR